MYLVYRLAFVALILYLKLDGLRTSPVIDRNKVVVDSDSNKSDRDTHADNNNNNSNNANDNNIRDTNNSDRAPVELLMGNGGVFNDDDDNDFIIVDGGDSTRSDNVNTLVAKSTPQINTTSGLMFANPAIPGLRGSALVNDSSYWAYEVVVTTTAPSDEATNGGFDPAPPKNQTTPSPRDDLSMPSLAEIASAASGIWGQSSTIAPGSEDEDIDGGAGDVAADIGEVEQFMLNYDYDRGDSCLLDGIKQSFMWWSYPNGSLSAAYLNKSLVNTFLDMSARNFSEESELFSKALQHSRATETNIIAFSAAGNLLTRAPYRTLSIMNSTLKYLTLRGNIFYAYSFVGNSDDGVAWATFPPLPELIELDISQCRIEYVAKEAFQNMTNLRRLYISHNKMLQIPADTFYHIQSVNYLDLSFTNVIEYTIPSPTLEAIFNLIYGVKIYQTTFKFLPNLEYLDLSHTKLTRHSAMAFRHLGEKLKFLSLCYTAFPMIGNAIFKRTALVALDLSGNPYASYNIIDDTFDDVGDTLKYLFFEKSNIKELDWLKSLTGVRVLGLAGNNINTVASETFAPLKNLQVLDLSSNHIGNWYSRVFAENTKLRLFNLRDNNINILTTEMLKDFQSLEYLGIGDNDFVCDCMLRDLVDIAASNNNDAECSSTLLQDAQEVIAHNMDTIQKYIVPNVTKLASLGFNKVVNISQKDTQPRMDIDMSPVIMSRYMAALQASYHNMKLYNMAQERFQLRFFSDFYSNLKDVPTKCNGPVPVSLYEKLNASNLKFQLLDYDDEHYWCFNETERFHFVQLDCQARNYVDEIAQQLHALTKYVLIGLGTLIGISLLGVLIYIKRWHIHYYYSSLKSAALVSVATKETVDKFNVMAETDPNLVYDIFISYCQNDRQWVLEELLPNVEDAGDISICMHERDFQIGLTILDNIISCMDRSKALMLIISSNFLLSHWCQFEMHLAQHRMFEASKEHLILVFLEDIPRSKRPKVLQYLMEVKTYIKWPSSKGGKEAKPEDKKIFWKRLKRSLENISLNRGESRA